MLALAGYGIKVETLVLDLGQEHINCLYPHALGYSSFFSESFFRSCVATLDVNVNSFGRIITEVFQLFFLLFLIYAEHKNLETIGV